MEGALALGEALDELAGGGKEQGEPTNQRDRSNREEADIHRGDHLHPSAHQVTSEGGGECSHEQASGANRNGESKKEPPENGPTSDEGLLEIWPKDLGVLEELAGEIFTIHSLEVRAFFIFSKRLVVLVLAPWTTGASH